MIYYRRTAMECLVDFWSNPVVWFLISVFLLVGWIGAETQCARAGDYDLSGRYNYDGGYRSGGGGTGVGPGGNDMVGGTMPGTTPRSDYYGNLNANDPFYKGRLGGPGDSFGGTKPGSQSERDYLNQLEAERVSPEWARPRR